MNIFVARMSPSTTGEDLSTLFRDFGTVKSAKVIFDRETGNSKGYGFVEMEDDAEGLNAINALNESMLHGKHIVVKKAHSEGEDPGGSVHRMAPSEMRADFVRSE